MYLKAQQTRTFPRRKMPTQYKPYIDALREPFSQTMNAIPPGIAGIDATLQQMRVLVDRYKINPTIRELALKITNDFSQKNFGAEINALYNFVKFHIRYVKDIHGVETLQTPTKTLDYEAGDCDDKSVLLATLLESIGHETRFHAMGFRTNHISHVLLEVKVNGEWLALDSTEPYSMGWSPPGIVTHLYR